MTTIKVILPQLLHRHSAIRPPRLFAELIWRNVAVVLAKFAGKGLAFESVSAKGRFQRVDTIVLSNRALMQM